MSKFGLRVNKCSIGLVAAAVAGFSVMPPAHADTTGLTPAAPRAAGSDNVTRSLRVVSPGVSVQAKPQAAKTPSTPAGVVPLREGQFAHLDQNGHLVPTLPPGVTIPPAPAAPPPVPQHSPKDPAALIFDTSHVRAVAIARVGNDGKPVVDCVDNTLKPNSDSEHSHAPKAAVQPGDGE